MSAACWPYLLVWLNCISLATGAPTARGQDAAETPAADSQPTPGEGDELQESEPGGEPERNPATEAKATSPVEEADAKLPAEATFREYMAIPLIGSYGRSTVHIDPVDASIAAGEFKVPGEDDVVTTADGREVSWRKATAGEDGVLSTRSFRGGYATTTFESPAAGTMLLEASGHAAAYVNGQPVAGDPYAFGEFDLPVQIVKGQNTFVFHVAQSQLKARLLRPTAQLTLGSLRVVLPSIVRNDGEQQLWGSVTLTNCSDQPLSEVSIRTQVNGQPQTTTPVAWLDAASGRACAFGIATADDIEGDTAELSIQVYDAGRLLAEQRYDLQVVDANQMHIRTYRSRVDRSVQDYVVVPAVSSEGQTHLVAKPRTSRGDAPGAIVALHTDGMTARDFAAQYQAKSWAHVIVPGGRGEFPLDWEDWSRIDASEALADAREHLEIDPAKLYVTGHGMGGHGALVLATASPNTFAAVATSAGWPSLWTYGGGMPDYRNPSNIQAMLLRAAQPSNTMALLENLRTAGVHLLHGADDDQVPAEQSRLVAQKLASWHNDFAFRELSDAGNWWGSQTVDSAATMDFLSARGRNEAVPQTVAFATSDLGTLSQCDWATIAAQDKQFEVSRVKLRIRNAPRTIIGTTENVRRLSISKEAVPEGEPFLVRLDGGRPIRFRGMPASGQVWLEKEGDEWTRKLSPDKSNKNPSRYGGLKAAFDHNVLLVYGTVGDEAENAWSRAKAHYDAETFAYRAGGSLQVIADSDFKASEAEDRNVVIYGNVDTNRAWAALLSTSPVQAERGRLRVGLRTEQGDDLAFTMVRPRTGTDDRLVAVVGGTGVKGMRLTNRLRYFWAGVAYPDWLLIGPEALTSGDPGIRAAGYFAEDWDVDDADIAWRDLAL